MEFAHKSLNMTSADLIIFGLKRVTLDGVCAERSSIRVDIPRMEAEKLKLGFSEYR